MDRKLPLISYTLAAISGICFIGGLVILSGEGSKNNVQTRGDIIHIGSVLKH